MNGTNDIHPGLVDFRLLAPEQLERLKRRGMLSARRERVETLRALSDWLGGRRYAGASSRRGARRTNGPYGSRTRPPGVFAPSRPGAHIARPSRRCKSAATAILPTSDCAGPRSYRR